MKCKICGGQVWSGALLHTHCLEQLQPVWHSHEEKPPTHIETILIDDVEEPFSISDPVLCEYNDGALDVARYYSDDVMADAWVKHDGTVIKPTRWMVIPK